MINLNYTATNTESFDESIFSDYFEATDAEAIGWAENVVQKAYDRGMVAEYIKRYRSEDLTEDQDYIDFWASMTIIFGYITVLIRKIGLDSPSQELLFKYLQQRNLFNNPEELLADLTYITENYYNEIKKRGTQKIYKSKEDGELVDGEVLRIFGYSALFKDYFLFLVREPYKTGWVVDRSSPLYKGIGHYKMANNSYENSEVLYLAQEVIDYYNAVIADNGTFEFTIAEYNDQFLAINPSAFPLVPYFPGVTDLTLYPTTGSPQLVQDGVNQAILLQEGDSIGGSDNNFNIKISPGITYEISFWIRGGGNFSFGLNGFNVNNVPLSFKNINDDTDTNFFFENIQLPRSDVYYLISGFVYLYDQTLVSGLKLDTNMNIGNNLKSQDQHRALIPQILGVSGEVFVYGLKVNVANVSRSSTFIQSVNHTDIIAINRNGSLSIEEIYQAIKYYMLPYKSVLSITELPNLDDPDVPVVIEGEDFLLNKENQGIISGTKLMKYIG